MDAARAFYAAVVGATPPVVRLPWAAAARGAPAHWLGHIGVPEVGATVKRFVAEGGERLGPMQSTEDGAELAVLRDPFGSVIGVRPEIEAPSSMVAWHQLHTHDQEQAFSFYADLFGWRGVDALAKDDERYLIFAWDSVAPPIGTIANTVASRRGVHPHWLYYFSVPDLDASLARAAELGGELLDGPRRLPRGTRIAVCHDPQGAEYGLRERPPSPPPPLRAVT